MNFLLRICRNILGLIKKNFSEEPAKILCRTQYLEKEQTPDYIMKAIDEHSYGYLTPYQVALYHPSITEEYRKSLEETIVTLERLVDAGWLRVTDMVCSLKKVIIPAEIFRLLEQEIRDAEREKKERLGLLHGRIEAESAHVKDLTDTVILEEKGFFKSRDFLGMNFTLKAHQMITKNMEKWLNLSKGEIIGTYHTHLVPHRSSPSLKDMALLMANPATPHLILCRRGSFAYTFKSYRRVLWMYFPQKTPLVIIRS